MSLTNLIEQIKSLSVKGLEDMFDQEKQLFCYRKQSHNNLISNNELSLRYTIIALLGLSRYESTGGSSPINVKTTLNSIIEQSKDIDNIGDLGLLLWLCALASPTELKRIPFNDNVIKLKSKYPDARQRKTTELAWFLTGLSYFAMSNIDQRAGLEGLAFSIYEMLKKNYGGKGIFGHKAKNSVSGMLRGRIGCFADQVYPIYALCKFAKAYGNEEALHIAFECGQTICHRQGPFGQWWWHYDSVTGKVVGRYPVYSVHQHGMAPMALHQLQQATARDFADHISKGLYWITGDNELSFNMIDRDRNVIWRSFYIKKRDMYVEGLSSLVGLHRNEGVNDDLKILYECYPYCLGWLLYAFSDHVIGKN